MSDSDLSDAPRSASVPSDRELEQALQKEVRDALKPGNDDPSITVSSMRKAAEEALGLEAGFYKGNEKWKEESKRIVHEAFEEYGPDTNSPAKAKPTSAKPVASSRPRNSKKRASPGGDDGPAKKKRRKSQTAVSLEEALSSPPSGLSEDEEQKPATKSKSKKSTKIAAATSAKPAKLKKKRRTSPKASESDLSDAPSEPAKVTNNAEASDSDLSVLIDADPPPKKKKQRKGSSSAPTETGSRKPSSAPKFKSKPKPDTAAADADPDAIEIKRLQSWLVKCGIRKLWGKELKPYDTPRAKIKHLKDMLADAGMTGRYSVEKANQIKESRELRADIEAVKEGAERWGKNRDADEGGSGGSGGDDGRTKPKRRLVRGAQVLDFLGSDEGEETD